VQGSSTKWSPEGETADFDFGEFCDLNGFSLLLLIFNTDEFAWFSMEFSTERICT